MSDKDFSDNCLEQLFIYISDNYDIKEFIEQLIDYVDINYNDSDDTEGAEEEVKVNIDKDGFLSLE